MEKKTIKAILDVIKDVSDRPGLYGCAIERQYIYFTDGYVAIRLEMNQYNGLLPIVNDGGIWVSGEQLKEDYKRLGARDIQLTFKNDNDQAKENEGRSQHPNFEKLWREWVEGEQSKEPVAIDPNVFKKLAPFGHMIMYHTDKRLVLFSGRGVNAIACPLTFDAEKELKGVSNGE